MNASQALAAILVVLGAMLPVLIAQPDTVVGPIPKVLLSAANAGVVALALYLKVQLPGRPDAS